MIVSADWVAPVASRPVRDGAVLVRGDRIQLVGPIGEVRAAAPDDTIERYPGCVIVPGLVNAHTHLSLTVLAGLAPRAPMPAWLRRVTHAVFAMGPDEFAASAALGAIQGLVCGVTCVGDIAYGPEPLAAAADVGVGGVFHWEVLGIEADDLSAELAETEFPTGEGVCARGRSRCGISPHSSYTSGPGLLRAAWYVAQAHSAGFAVHVAESRAERELMLEGTGPLAPTARRLARGFFAPRVGSVRYLEGLGVLQGALAIHCAVLEPGDAALLKRSARGVVLCPRSNAFLGNGQPPVQELSAAGVRLAVGTDSSASNDDLDLFAEARAVRALDPALTARRTLRMITADGAAALGLDGELGTLEPGKAADLVVVRTGTVDDPEAAVVRKGGCGTVDAVMAAGVWRVREGAPAFPTGPIERAAAKARSVAAQAIERGDGPG